MGRFGCEYLGESIANHGSNSESRAKMLSGACGDFVVSPLGWPAQLVKV